MATLSDYFAAEARDCLGQIDRVLDRRPIPDATELHRATRMLRGSAQLAREDRMFRAASALETTARSLTAGALTWSPDIVQRMRDALVDLRALLDRGEDDGVLDGRVAASVTRWQDVGLPEAAAPRAAPANASEFRAFAGREAAGIADTLDRGIQQLAAAPMDREPLKAILRRQRALLGAARLDDVPVIAEILRAIEDLTRVIAKLDVGVKQEWLDIYRVAREGLRAAVGPLERDENPPSSHALSRLRHMRAELLERYGADDAGGRPPDGLFREPQQEPVPQGGADAPDELVLDEPVAQAEPAPDTGAGATVGGEAAVPEQVVPIEALAVPEDIATGAGELLLEQEAVAGSSGELLLEQEAAESPGELLLEQQAGAGSAGERVLEHEAPVEAAGELVLDEEVAEMRVGDVAANEDDVAGDSDVVAIDDLCYTRDQALHRALELRERITRATAGDADAREAAHELFDLIRIALD